MVAGSTRIASATLTLVASATVGEVVSAGDEGGANRDEVVARETGIDLAVEPTGGAVAAEASPDAGEPRRRRWGLMVLETAGGLSVPTVWYWLNTDLNSADWELHWDWPSWRDKLFTLDAISFDTNQFSFNAVRHPAGGLLHYQIGRANGFGMLGATVINMTAAAFWEYVVEFKEKVSLNDLIVNTWTGFNLGEPLFQIGRLADVPGATLPQRVLGLTVSPLDGLHKLARHGSWRRPSRLWHRASLFSGGNVRVEDGQRRGELRLGLDAEVVSHPGHGQSGTASAWTAPGALSRLMIDVGLGDYDGEFRSLETRVRTQTTFTGYHRRSIDASGHGWQRFMGLGTTFQYRTRRLLSEWDRLAILGLIGPQIRLETNAGSRTVSVDLLATVDFAMVQAHVFGPVPLFAPAGPLTSALRANGYYYATGLSAQSRVRVEDRYWAGELSLDGHHFWSIDGRDRIEVGDSEDDPHDVSDERLDARVQLDVAPLRTAWRLGVYLDVAWRRGQWKALDRRSTELDSGLVMKLSF